MKKTILTLVLIVASFFASAQSMAPKFYTWDIQHTCQLQNVNVNKNDVGGKFTWAWNNFTDSAGVYLVPVASSPLAPDFIWRGTYNDGLAMPTYAACSSTLSMISFKLPASWPLGITKIYDHNTMLITFNVVNGIATTVEEIENNAQIINKQYYDLNGVLLKEKPTNGLILIKETYDNGAVKTKKIYIM